MVICVPVSLIDPKPEMIPGSIFRDEKKGVWFVFFSVLFEIGHPKILDIGIETSTPNTKCSNYVCRIVEEVVISLSCLHLQVALKNITEFVVFATCVHIYVYIFTIYVFSEYMYIY